MENKSIEITIADRKYPVIIPANEEKLLLEAEQFIKERISKWQKQLTGKDNQDYLSLTLVTYLVEMIKERNDRDTKLKFLETKILSMNKHITALNIEVIE